MEPTQGNREIQELLRKLRTGMLSEEEWSQLRKAAKGDPFLQDSIEGLLTVDDETRQLHLKSIEHKLQIAEKSKRRVIALPRLAGAAAVLLLLAASWWIWNLQPDQSPDSAMTEFTEEPELLQPELESEETSESLDDNPALTLEKDSRVTPPTIPPATVPEQPAASIRGASAEDKSAVIIDGVPLNPPEIELVEESSNAPEAAESTVAYEDKESDAIRELESGVSREDVSELMTNLASADGPSILNSMQQITGLVRDDTGEPLIGANILLKGTENGTLTDLDGNFKLDLPESVYNSPSPTTLVVSYTGYTPQETSASPGDSLFLQLAEGMVLNEVVVTGLEKKRASRASRPAGRAFATPVGGERRYQRYLRQSLRMPAAAKESGIRGEVELEFQIDESGRPTDIRVLQSLGYGCDEEATRLVEDGPDWDLSSAQVPIARVTVKF